MMQILDDETKKKWTEDIVEWIRVELDSDNWTYLYNILNSLKQYAKHSTSD